MNIKDLILRKIEKNNQVRVAEIVSATGFSRTYINKFFAELVKEEKITRLGKANKTIYVLAKKSIVNKAKNQLNNINLVILNKNLSEDNILTKIKNETGIFNNIPENVAHIANYAFLEMLNNAIEHSKSKTIHINFNKFSNLEFEITDTGIGIFNNIRKEKKLKNDLEAIQDLLKGKQTTKPQKHSGQGIFFTSKIADKLIIQSSNKKLIFDNLLDDVFIEDTKEIKGTKIKFFLSVKSKVNLKKIFDEYSVGLYDFNRTKIKIKLFQEGSEYISRSQARRLIVGLDKFKEIILDFKNVKVVGQAFCDEIFRIWQTNNPKIAIKWINANKNIDFMINRSKN